MKTNLYLDLSDIIFILVELEKDETERNYSVIKTCKASIIRSIISSTPADKLAKGVLSSYSNEWRTVKKTFPQEYEILEKIFGKYLFVDLRDDL